MLQGVNMSLAHQHHPSAGNQVTVWFANERPARIVYRDIRYRVSDIPTRLEDEMIGMTHPLPITGWRFQGTDPDGRSLMFDVRDDPAGWILIRAYE
jgi:hypothetical protein